MLASASWNPHVDAKARMSPGDWFSKTKADQPKPVKTPDAHRTALEAWAAAGFGRMTNELDA